jgi:DNA-binding IclR family transcriptional regulator
MTRNAAITASARFVFSVLRLAATADMPLSIADMSRRLDVSVNKAYRAAVTLERAGYLHRNADGRFEIGPVTEQLVYAAFEQFHIRPIVAPYLRQIATSAQATTSLAVRIGWYTVTLAVVESGSNIVSRKRRLGRASLIDSDARGLAILAWLPSAEVQKFFAFAARRSADAKRTPAISARRLAGMRFAGFAVMAPNTRQQVSALSIPLRDAAGQPIASITIDAPNGRAVPLNRDPLLKDWLEMAAQAEAAVRGRPGFVAPYAFADPDVIDFAER